MAVYRRLSVRYDIDRWHWQAGTPVLDICLGAVLVQHTSWTNVEKALANLRVARAFSLEALEALPEDELAALVRPVGTPLTKARRVKSLVALARARGGFEELLALPAAELRSVLLATHGIGPETADVIVLYGAKALTIVHDAYTARLMRRLGTGPAGNSYGAWQEWEMARLPRDAQLYRELHAAIVVHCKETCRARPKCDACVLLDLCPFGQGLVNGRAGIE
jgi:endonuclease-3 related protein